MFCLHAGCHGHGLLLHPTFQFISFAVLEHYPSLEKMTNSSWNGAVRASDSESELVCEQRFRTFHLQIASMKDSLLSRSGSVSSVNEVLFK